MMNESRPARDLSSLKGSGMPPRKPYQSIRMAPAPPKPSAPAVPLGPAPNTEVYLDLQVMLRVAVHCSENSPTVMTGELVGLEVWPGFLEVSNCFPTPQRRDIWNPRERPDFRALEEKHSKEVDKYRANMRELFSYVDADCQSVGWYQTMTHTAFSDPAVVDQLYQRMKDVDRATIILGFDLERHMTGQFPFRAFHLSPQYIALKRAQETAGGDLASTSQLIKGLASSGDILSELVVHAKSNVATNCLLARVPCDLERRAALDCQAQLNSAGQLERGLTYLAESLEQFTAESERLAKYQKDSSRFHQSLKRTIERKRNENEQRRADGEELLVIEEETTLSNFEKRIEVPDQLKSVMMLKQVTSVASGVSTLAKLNVAASALIG